MSVRLGEMSASGFARRRTELVRDTAVGLSVGRGLSAPEAEAAARETVAQMLPDGPATAGQLVRAAVAGDGTTVGWIWVSMPGFAVPDTAWICDIVVDPPYRRRGHAAAIIRAAEAELARLGAARIGLNVLGSNDTARRLYERLGFETLRQVRSRSLPDGPAQLSSSVRLVPIQPADLHRRLAATAAPSRSHLPDDPDPDEYFVRTAMAGDAEVGWIYYGRYGPGRSATGWIYQIDVDEPYRSRGYGTAMIAAAEADLVRRGARSIGLYVRGDNTGAQRLYERLGFALVSQDMTKPLPTP